MFGFKIYRIQGHSMEPALPAGSFVLATRWFKKIKVSDIVSFKHDDQLFIKRVTEIKNNQLWLLGDNPADSLDSRTFGWVDYKSILGKIIWY
jgi:nickel-type superoxide dismutase maturation protease